MFTEGQLLPVNVDAAYDRHQDLLTLLNRVPSARRYELAHIVRLSWGGPLRPSRRPSFPHASHL